jgi:hypothetical protein
MLSGWAIPQDLSAAAPEPPYFFDPVVFTGAGDDAVQRPDDTPSDRAAREALSVGGQVLGVGAGAASLRLGAGYVIGLDPRRMLLDAFAERAERLGVDHTQIEGAWPAIVDGRIVLGVVFAIDSHRREGSQCDVGDLAGDASGCPMRSDVAGPKRRAPIRSGDLLELLMAAPSEVTVLINNNLTDS